MHTNMQVDQLLSASSRTASVSLDRCKVFALPAAVRSSSAASDPSTEKLECFLDQRSLMGMLTQRTQDDAAALQDPRPLVSSFAFAWTRESIIDTTASTGAECMWRSYLAGSMWLCEVCCALMLGVPQGHCCEHLSDYAAYAYLVLCAWVKQVSVACIPTPMTGRQQLQHCVLTS